MALAWVELKNRERNPVFEVKTGNNAYFDLFITTSPELMMSTNAAQRTQDNFYSSREAYGNPLRSQAGAASFPLPEIFHKRFPNANLYYMVKTYRDEAGNGPALSPVLQGNTARVLRDPVDPTEASMDSQDYESALDELLGKARRQANTPRTQATGYAHRNSHRVQNLSAGAALQKNGPGTAESEIANVLALCCERIRAGAAADSSIPGRPSYVQVVRVLSHTLAHTPANYKNPRGPSAATVANALIYNKRRRYTNKPGLEARALEHALVTRQVLVKKAARLSRQADFGISAILMTALPMLLQALPTILPIITKLLSGAKSQSLGLAYGLTEGTTAVAVAPAAATPPAVPTLPTDPNAQAALAAQIMQAVGAQPTGGTSAVAAPTTGGEMAPGASGSNPGIALLQSLASNPQAISTLMPLLSQLAPGNLPGAQMMKSVIDRLPIEKMFDGQSWIPTINHDQFISTLPWDKVLAFSAPEASLALLAVPGRDELKPLEGSELRLVDLPQRDYGAGQSSLVFRADVPTRLKVELQSGNQGLEMPFLDVRISRDGRAANGIHRAAFRLQPVGAGQNRRTTIEIPPSVWAAAGTQTDPICISIRLVEQRGNNYFGLERRLCAFIVHASTIVPETGAAVLSAAELDRLPGLALPIPASELPPDGLDLLWNVDITSGDSTSGLGRFLPVTQGRDAAGRFRLRGGIEITPTGLVDLMRYHPDMRALSAETRLVLAQALQNSPFLRARMGLHLNEALGPETISRLGRGLEVRLRLGWLPAWLVRFDGVGPEGSPLRRAAQNIHIPIPLGLSIGPTE